MVSPLTRLDQALFNIQSLSLSSIDTTLFLDFDIKGQGSLSDIPRHQRFFMSSNRQDMVSNKIYTTFLS